MAEATVQHPEVDETLYVDECVIRVGCPICKVKAGVPCKGARFKWLAQGSRRGFRYTQGTHYPRRDLFQVWKKAGRPKRLPSSAVAKYITVWGDFPRTVDWKTVVTAPPKPIRKAKAKPAVAKRVKREKAKTGLYERYTIEHNGVTWESFGGSLWTWCPYMEYGDFTSVTVFDYKSSMHSCVTVRFRKQEHSCETREEGFDLAAELVIKTALLDVFSERAKWRVRELERRFGHLMGAT